MIFFNKGRRIDLDSGSRLMEYRKSKKLTRPQFAEMTGLSENFIYKLETGRKDLTLDTAIEISRKADIDFIWLITGIKL